MDTRNKILTPARAVETALQLQRNGSLVKVVTGCFDPLLAGHARRLRQIGGPGCVLIVILATARNSILPARARAELVAALSVVDYVVLPEETTCEDLLGRLPADEVIREEAADEQRTQDLIRHVHQRQQTG